MMFIVVAMAITTTAAAATFQDKTTPNRRLRLRPLYAFFLVSCFPLQPLLLLPPLYLDGSRALLSNIRSILWLCGSLCCSMSTF